MSNIYTDHLATLSLLLGMIHTGSSCSNGPFVDQLYSRDRKFSQDHPHDDLTA
jgi:hypothetical protein